MDRLLCRTLLQIQLQCVDSMDTLNPEPTHTLPVYQDGAFFAQLPPGSYQATIITRLTGEVVAEAVLNVVVGENYPVIQLEP